MYLMLRDMYCLHTLRININTNPLIFSFQLDDAALQVYKDGDYGAYLDLESSLAEQAEDIEGINSR